MRFVHETLCQRVVFAPGSAAEAVHDEVGSSRVMLIGTRLDVPAVLRWDEVVMHVPVAVAERARAAAAARQVEVIVSVGGGSATGLAKAVALTTGLPVVAVPTTYAGSEATNVWGLTANGRKTTGTDPRVLPRTVVYDATLTATLPTELAVASGLNALAHCVDSLWAPRADPINAALAGEGIRALMAALPDDREQMFYGTYLAAVAFASAGSGLHHKICHVLGGMFGLPHAQTHAVVLPHVLALNAPGAGGRITLDELQDLRRRVDAPRALRDYGFEEDQIPAAVEAILPVVPDNNPVPVNAGNLKQLLHDAWEGTR
ncbi:maleylacetate reductase [Actinoplanes sp. NPDC051633]|uniref:maleylacetate reductase n=1 Tax=Actinoplanes sp. NPDC051633 TaxID=3155670 RepID=UPI00342CFB6E